MIEKKIADTLLDEPVKITVNVKAEKIKPSGFKDRFLQFTGLKPKTTKPETKVFEIRGATLRTMIRIARLLLSIKKRQVDSEGALLELAYEMIEEETETMAEIIATAIHNQKSEVPKELKDLILDNMDGRDINRLSAIVVENLNISDFINSITSIRSINLLENPVEKVSQVTEEIIASGE